MTKSKYDGLTADEVADTISDFTHELEEVEAWQQFSFLFSSLLLFSVEEEIKQNDGMITRTVLGTKLIGHCNEKKNLGRMFENCPRQH